MNHIILAGALVRKTHPGIPTCGGSSNPLPEVTRCVTRCVMGSLLQESLELEDVTSGKLT